MFYKHIKTNYCQLKYVCHTSINLDTFTIRAHTFLCRPWYPLTGDSARLSCFARWTKRAGNTACFPGVARTLAWKTLARAGSLAPRTVQSCTNCASSTSRAPPRRCSNAAVEIMTMRSWQDDEAAFHDANALLRKIVFIISEIRVFS